MTTASLAARPDQTTHGSPQRAAVELANALALNSMNRILSIATVATATTTSKVKTTTTATFTVGGAFQAAVVATDNLWTLGGTNSATLVAAGSFQKYLLCWDSTGASAPSVYEGTQSTVNAASVTWSNISAVSTYAPLLTVLNAGLVIVGVLTVATDATHTFNPGTTLLGASGITATYVDGSDATLLPIIANLEGSIIGSGV